MRRFLSAAVLTFLSLPALVTGQVFTEYLAGGSPATAPHEMTAGPDGAFWYCERAANRIAQITVTGVVTEYPAPSHNVGLDGITTGPDGNIWFAEKLVNKIARLHLPAPTDGSPGTFDEFAVPGRS
jgi:streptogramin lyase